MFSKSTLRSQARARRAVLAADMPDLAERLAEHAHALQIPDGSLVGAYVAIADEADPHLLLEKLALQNCAFAFPRVAAQNLPLAFHHWKAGRELARSAFGVPEPSPDWPIAYPKILLVPLLAFDASGQRLGYGGGYYDRTLAALPGVLAFGVAYAGQEVAMLPRQDHDHPLNGIVTENGARRFHHS